MIGRSAWRAGPGTGIHRLERRAGLRRLAALLLLPVVIGLLSVPPVTGDELADARAQQKSLSAKIKAQKAQVAQLEALQEELRQQIDGTRTQLAQVNRDLTSVRRFVTLTQRRVAAVRNAYRDLVAQLKELEADLAALEAEEAAKTIQLAERKNLLAQRLKAAYQTGKTSLLETVLFAESFTEVLSDVASYLEYGEQDRVLADQIARDRETLATLRTGAIEARGATEEARIATLAHKKELDARLADFKAAQAELKRLERETARQLAIQRNAFKKLAYSETSLRKVLAADVAAQARLKRQIDELVRRRSQGGGIPSQFSGSLAWPLVGVVSQNFGCTGFSWEPPLGNCAHFHRGIDIAAPKYRAIRAAGDGLVVFAGANPYDGFPRAWIVIIAHSESLLTWYGHVDNAVRPPAVHAGQQVEKGDVIAYVGMTGRTTGPHLHWMVELNGEFVNPRLFL